MAQTTRPELLKQRSFIDNDGRRNGKALHGVLSFPAKPMPHGLLLQFKKYDYQTYVSAIVKAKDEQGKDTVEENKNLGFVGSFALGSGLENDYRGTAVPQLSASNAIELPFPRTLQDSNNIRVAQFERDFLYERIASGIASFDEGGGISGMLGNAMETARQVANSTYSYMNEMGTKFREDGAIAAIESTLKQIGQNVGSFDAGKAAALAGYLGRNFISGEIAKSIAVVGERTVNPQETLSFSGVDLRNFTFTWDLFPSNKNDSDNIRKIVRLIKQHSLPTTESAGAGASTARAFLNYPSIVELNLLGVDEAHFMRFKRCMIGQINVDYGVGGMPEIIKGGRPAAVSLSISFSELQIQTSEDYGGTGLKPGDKDFVDITKGSTQQSGTNGTQSSGGSGGPSF